MTVRCFALRRNIKAFYKETSKWRGNLHLKNSLTPGLHCDLIQLIKCIVAVQSLDFKRLYTP